MPSKRRTAKRYSFSVTNPTERTVSKALHFQRLKESKHEDCLRRFLKIVGLEIVEIAMLKLDQIRKIGFVTCSRKRNRTLEVLKSASDIGGATSSIQTSKTVVPHKREKNFSEWHPQDPSKSHFLLTQSYQTSVPQKHFFF